MNSHEKKRQSRFPDSQPNAHDTAIMTKIEDVKSDAVRDYIENRVIPQMNWYAIKSSDYKDKYHHNMIASIVMGAMIPIFAVASDGPFMIQIMIALLGTSMTAVNAYLTLTNPKELWISYRDKQESLKKTLYYYFNSAGQFAEGNETEKDRLLIERCEAEMTLEKEE